jgi:hypothetical protein
MEQQVANKHQNAARPDKVNNDSHQEYLKGQKARQLSKHISSDVASDGKMALDEEMGDVGVDTDDPAEFPPMSTVDTSESEPEMSGLVDGEFGSEAGDEDFKPESEDELKDDEEEATDDEDLEELFKSHQENHTLCGRGVARMAPYQPDMPHSHKQEQEHKRCSKPQIHCGSQFLL